MKLQAHLFEVLTGVHVCQIEKLAGSSMDFMRCYAQLASRLQPIMMKRRAFPTATHARQLLAATPSMNEEQARAIMDVPRHSSGSEMDEGSAGGSLGTRFDAVASTTGAAGGSGLGSCSLPGSLGSIPEDALAHTAQGAGCMAQARSDSMPSGSLPGGASSPLAGGSPRSVAELPHGQARPCAHAGQQQQQQQHLTEQQQQRQQVTAALAGGGESPVSGAGSGDGG